MAGLYANFKLEGIEQVMADLLKAIPSPENTNSILIKAGEPLKQAIKASMPVFTGNLKASVDTLTVKANRTVIGVRYPGGSHIFLVEYGTAERERSTKDGKMVSTGAMPVGGYIRRAYDAHKATILSSLEKDFTKAITKK